LVLCWLMEDIAWLIRSTTAMPPWTSFIRLSPLASNAASFAAIFAAYSTAIPTHGGIASTTLCPNVSPARAMAWVMIGTICATASAISWVTSAIACATT
jgi:hypothetical protein